MCRVISRWPLIRAVAICAIACMGIALQLGCSETEQSSPARPGSTDASDQKAEASPGEVMRPPLVIVYLIDALRADHLGLYGYPRATSPEIDQLATESVVFDAAYAQASWTRPSVGSLFTGRLPSRHGAVRRSHRLRSDVATLSEVFRDAGYRTAAFFTNPNLLPDFGFERGFDKYVDIASVGIEADADEVHAAVLDHLDTSVWPQFLYVHTIDPHAPYKPPAPFHNRFIGEQVPAPDDVERSPEARLELDFYDAEIAYADHALGGFLDALRERGLYDDSLFVLLSDHGEEFLEHGNIRHGYTLFEEQIRVPLLVRFPHARWGGRRVRESVRIVDVLPALVDLLGEEAPTGLDGSSFLDLISGSDAIDRRVLFSEENMDSSVLTSLREGNLKLIKRESPANLRGVELYDLANDPGEREDVSGVRAEETERLLAHLEAIESSLHGGLYLELNNASHRQAAGSMQVQLAISGGLFHGIEPKRFRRRRPLPALLRWAAAHSRRPVAEQGKRDRVAAEVDRRCRSRPHPDSGRAGRGAAGAHRQPGWRGAESSSPLDRVLVAFCPGAASLDDRTERRGAATRRRRITPGGRRRATLRAHLSCFELHGRGGRDRRGT